MSRIGKKTINIPAGVTVDVQEGNFVVVKGPKGELSFQFNSEMAINIEGNEINIVRPTESQAHRTIHGTTRAVLHNMVVGVSEGFKKALEIKGVGYRAQLTNGKLVINAGYSNPVELEIPEGITDEVPKNTDIIISGADKQLVGEYAAKVRGVRSPEPYKGKGIKYVDEVVRRKEGKTSKK